MANVTFIRDIKSVIDSTPIVDGQVLFTTDQLGDDKIYADIGSTRIQIGGTVTVDANLSTTSNNTVRNSAITNNINNLICYKDYLLATGTTPSKGTTYTVIGSPVGYYPIGAMVVDKLWWICGISTPNRVFMINSDSVTKNETIRIRVTYIKESQYPNKQS